MATAEQIAELRDMVSEPDSSNGYTDEKLNERIDSNAGDLNTTAASIWQEKASTYSEMVDISEAGSSRKNSQLMSNALTMSKHFAGLATAGAPVPGTDIPTTTPIVRA